jgi:hypothetical protein
MQVLKGRQGCKHQGYQVRAGYMGQHRCCGGQHAMQSRKVSGVQLLLGGWAGLSRQCDHLCTCLAKEYMRCGRQH